MEGVYVQSPFRPVLPSENLNTAECGMTLTRTEAPNNASYMLGPSLT